MMTYEEWFECVFRYDTMCERHWDTGDTKALCGDPSEAVAHLLKVFSTAATWRETLPLARAVIGVWRLTDDGDLGACAESLASPEVPLGLRIEAQLAVETLFVDFMVPAYDRAAAARDISVVRGMLSSLFRHWWIDWPAQPREGRPPTEVNAAELVVLRNLTHHSSPTAVETALYGLAVRRSNMPTEVDLVLDSIEARLASLPPSAPQWLANARHGYW